MVIVYNILFFLFSVFYLPALLFKGKFHADFPRRFGIEERKCLDRIGKLKNIIWIHAVSVGEVCAAKLLIDKIYEKVPGAAPVLTTTTKTGYALALQTLGNRTPVLFSPLDFSFVTRRFIRMLKPRLFGMMETELWPNLITSLSEANVPIVLLNGRISDNSFKRYRIARLFMRPLLHKISSLCMQTRTDAQRIRQIGAPSDSVTVTGNMKFDASSAGSGGSSDAQLAASVRSRLRLNGDEKVIVAGSTHPGEEEVLVTAFTHIVKDDPRVRLLIAPRHVERIADVERIIMKNGMLPERISRLSESASVRADRPSVLLMDSIGQLKETYAAATVVFVGGSLIKKGGHNLVEPALFGKAILCGPYMHNFRDMAAQFAAQRALIIVKDGSALARELNRLLRDDAQRVGMGERARRLVAENQGATERNVEAIRLLLAGAADE